MRRFLFIAAVVILAAGCSQTKDESTPAQPTISTVTQAPATPAPLPTTRAVPTSTLPDCSEVINGAPATCGVVTKLHFYHSSMWGTAGDEWSMRVKTDAGDIAVVNGDNDDAQQLKELVSVGNRVAYVVGTDGVVHLNSVKVLPDSLPQQTCGVVINGKPATCGVVTKLHFYHSSFWGTAGDEWSMTVRTDAGSVVVVNSDNDDAQDLHEIVLVNSRVAYALNQNGVVGFGDVKVLS